MKIKNIIVWGIIFAVLTAYSWQLILHINDSTSYTVYAASPRDIVGEQERTLFARVIDRLTLRKERAEDQCNTSSGASAAAHCMSVSIFARFILLLSSHVS
jgi:hypothetical protein